jgi:hypothetical protein
LQVSIFCLFYLRESNILLKDLAQKLFQSEQKLQQGRDVSFLLSQHLKDLLTQDDSSDEQAPGFQEQLAKGCWLAECLVLKLSPGEMITGPDFTQLCEIPSSQTLHLQNDCYQLFWFPG